jgi:hypothetical protein
MDGEMKKVLYVLFAVLMIGIMGLGCEKSPTVFNYKVTHNSTYYFTDSWRQDSVGNLRITNWTEGIHDYGAMAGYVLHKEELVLPQGTYRIKWNGR